MANLKISAATVNPAVADTDMFPTAKTGDSTAYKTTMLQYRTALESSLLPLAGGTMTGRLTIDAGWDIPDGSLTLNSAQGVGPAIFFKQDGVLHWEIGFDDGSTEFVSVYRRDTSNVLLSQDVIRFTDEYWPSMGYCQFPPLAQWHMVIGGTSKVGFIIQGMDGQAHDLQQWQNNLGVAKACLTQDGNLVVAGDTLVADDNITVYGRVGARSFRLAGSATDYLTATTPLIYGASNTGSAPFDLMGNLVIQPRAHDSAVLVIAAGATPARQVTIGKDKIGFFGAAAAAKPTGVAVTAEGIHAALVSLGLIAA